MCNLQCHAGFLQATTHEISRITLVTFVHRSPGGETPVGQSREGRSVVERLPRRVLVALATLRFRRRCRRFHFVGFQVFLEIVPGIARDHGLAHVQDVDHEPRLAVDVRGLVGEELAQGQRRSVAIPLLVLLE